MDISNSLKSCKNIEQLLKDFPKYKRCPITVEIKPKREIELAHKEILKRCTNFINKIIKETTASLKQYEDIELGKESSKECNTDSISDDKSISAMQEEALNSAINYTNTTTPSAVESTPIELAVEENLYKKMHKRKIYIKNKLKEAKQAKSLQEKKIELINEIEALQALAKHKVERTVFDEQESFKIIEFLFENEFAIDQQIESELENFISLTYDKEANKKTEAYEKIIQSI